MHNICTRSGQLLSAVTTASVLLFIVAAAGASAAVALPVKFLSQGSGNNNCGPVSLVMAGCYVKGQEPTSAKVTEINRALGVTDLDFKSAEQLITAGQKVFGLTLQKHHWDLQDVKNEVQAGGPVIVAVKARLLPNRGYPYQGDHFVLVIGFGGDQITCDDPGTSEGGERQYAASDFDQAMKSEGGVVVVGFEKTTKFRTIRILRNTAIDATGIGDVEVSCDDGQVVQVTHTGRCECPAISPDRRTAAWLNVPQEEIDRHRYYSREITLFRGNAVLRTLADGFCGFLFSPDNRHIAVASPGRIDKEFELVDMDTGAVVASCHNPSYYGTSEKVPDWAQAIYHKFNR